MKRRLRKKMMLLGLAGMILVFTGCGDNVETTEPEITREADERDGKTEEQVTPEVTQTVEDETAEPAYGKMPLVLIHTENGEEVTDDETYIGCEVTVTNCEEPYEIKDAPAGIRIRGNSTQMYAKKPYRVKFEEKQQVLGLSEGAHKSWVLLAEFNDPSLLRNLITYRLANGMSGISYATDCALVEVYLNEEYIGVYLLAEQTQVDEKRIAVDEAGVADATLVDTGYLLELEADLSRRNEEGAEGEAWFAVTGYASEKDNSMQMLMERSFDEKSAYYVVKSDARSPEQMEYIKNYMIQVYDAVYKETTKEAVEQLVDLPSAVDMYLVQLIANDYDNNYSSMYLYKDAGGKLQFGAPWDFDLAYGNFTGFTEAEDTVYVYHLLKKLGEYDWFREMAKSRFEELSCGEKNVFTAMRDTVTELTERYEDEFEREYVRWRDDLMSMAGGDFGTFGGFGMPEGGFEGFGNWEVPEGGFEGFGNWEVPEGGFEGFGNFGMPEEGFGSFGGFGPMENFSYGAVYDTHGEAADALLLWIEKRMAWIQTFLRENSEV